MHFEILGSGGAVVTPKPFCACGVCKEAKVTGGKNARSGPSVFLHDAKILFDTPEDSARQLTRSGIDSVKACFYSHWHPDHTMGRRVWEYKRDCASFKVSEPTDLFLPDNVLDEFKDKLGLWNHLQFLERAGLVRIQVAPDGRPVYFDNFAVTPIALRESYCSGFVIEEATLRTLLLMDEHIGWLPDSKLRNPDLAILPMGILTVCPWTNRPIVAPDHPIHGLEATFQETLELIKLLNPGRVVLLHIEEPAQISYERGRELGDKVSRELRINVEFAYDQMIIEL